MSKKKKKKVKESKQFTYKAVRAAYGPYFYGPIPEGLKAVDIHPISADGVPLLSQVESGKLYRVLRKTLKGSKDAVKRGKVAGKFFVQVKKAADINPLQEIREIPAAKFEACLEAANKFAIKILEKESA